MLILDFVVVFVAYAAVYAVGFALCYWRARGK